MKIQLVIVGTILIVGGIMFFPETINQLPEGTSIFDALVLGVRDYAQKCGFKTALIGLSGGIDSALVSAIATAAMTIAAESNERA